MPDRRPGRERQCRRRNDQAARVSEPVGAKPQDPAVTKPKLATMWLDGCSGCHMSLLDVDEALLTIASKADLVYGPLVDAQEFPHGVDVTIIEGGVSTDEDVEKLRRARERSRFLISLGDCATT